MASDRTSEPPASVSDLFCKQPLPYEEAVLRCGGLARGLRETSLPLKAPVRRAVCTQTPHGVLSSPFRALVPAALATQWRPGERHTPPAPKKKASHACACVCFSEMTVLYLLQFLAVIIPLQSMLKIPTVPTVFNVM